MSPQDQECAGERLHYLDNVRSVIIVFVVLFHAILPYSMVCPWWYVIDSRGIPQALLFILFFDVVLMPVLFFISGMMARPSYERNGPARFMAAKVRRLLAPFVLCTLFFSPIMSFIRQWLRSAETGSDPLGFLAHWFVYLKGGMTITTGLPGRSTELLVNQYWFLMMLFVFFAGFCAYKLLRGERGSRGEGPEPGDPPSWRLLLLQVGGFGLALGLVYTLACILFDGHIWVTFGGLLQFQPAKMPIYLGFFIAGIHVERRNLLPRLLKLASPAVWLVSAVLVTTGYFAAVLSTLGVDDPSPALGLISRFLRIFLLLTVTFWALVFFERHAGRPTVLWRELSDSSYDVYLIHMVPQVVLQLIALSWPTPVWPTCIAVSMLTLLVSWLLSRFLVRKSATAAVAGMVLLFLCLCFWLR